MHNYKLIIEYEGTDYSGWQIQNNAVTIQGEITEKISQILQSEINLIGSGRTDAGVHALGQVANFRFHKPIEIKKFVHSLNSLLPSSIAIKSIEEVDEEFHSRFDAKRRGYIYLMNFSKTPFYKNLSWYNPISKEYDLKQLNLVSKSFLGEHDFTSFAKAKTEIDNKICKIHQIGWRRKNNLTIFYVQANRFLHGMVRTLVGTILELRNESEYKEKISEILNAKDRTIAGASVKASGLFLHKIKY